MFYLFRLRSSARKVRAKRSAHPARGAKMTRKEMRMFFMGGLAGKCTEFVDSKGNALFAYFGACVVFVAGIDGA